jgi:integrase
MSIERLERKNGHVYRVRWRDEHGQAHSRVVGRKRDAEALDADLKRAKRLGSAAPIGTSTETLEEFAKLWWQRHAAPNLARHTQANYASMLDVHLIPRIGDHRLTELTVEVVSDLRAKMAGDGVGDQAILKALTVLQSILQRAVEWRRIDRNPVRDVRKPSQARTRVVRPLPPQAVERMRAYLLDTDRRLDATLVSVLAYAGLRPGEAIGLRWHDLSERTLLIERSVAFGQIKPTKTASTRSVRLLAPLQGGPAQLARTHEPRQGPRPDLPVARRLAVERRPCPQLAQARVRRGRRARRRRTRTAVRPATQLRQPLDRPGRNRGRSRPPGRPRADDDAVDLRPSVRRTRRGRSPARRRPDLGGPRRPDASESVRFVSACRAPSGSAHKKSPD